MRNAVYTIRMVTRYEHSGVVWVDFDNPTAEEIRSVAKEFTISHALTEDLLSPTSKPRADVYGECIYLVLHFPSLRYTRGAHSDQEIDIILGKNFLITTHYGTPSATFDLGKSFEAASLLSEKKEAPVTAGFMFLELMQRLYQATEHELDALEDTINAIEEKIFIGHEREMVTAISYAGRELLTHQRLMDAHHAILKRLEQATVVVFGEEAGYYARGASALHHRVHSRVVSMNGILDELRETNMALLYTKQNEIMKNLTVMAFVTFPLTLLAAVFGMNTVDTPILGIKNDFYWILGGMAALMLFFFAYFKARKWF